ncbi:MAG: NAD(+) synthase [Weeksellaceae bacterium]
MKDNPLTLNLDTELNRIQQHIKTVLAKTGFHNVILGVSGGIDSATSLYLLRSSIPAEHIFVVHFPYFENFTSYFQETIKDLGLPKKNVLLSPIKSVVDAIAAKQQLSDPQTADDKLRLGNIMARVRMTLLYDLAKKHDALVCGTENKTENYLGYFTRFGDAASDFEVINHLYKTQVRELAAHLKVPQKIIDVSPTAGLWEGQTDEKELGFSYEEADQVLFQYFEKKIPLVELQKDFPTATQIVETAQKNAFKQEVPYLIK